MEIAAELRSQGKDVSIYPRVQIVRPEVVSVGNSVSIDDFTFIYGGLGVTIGDFVHIAPHCFIGGGGRFVAMDFAGLSARVTVYTGTDDYHGAALTNPTVPLKYRVVDRSEVVLEKHALVGAGSVLLPGVRIGEGAVVGAMSLVRKDCEPWTIYAGVPARAVGQRSRENILRMEEQLRAEAYDAAGRYVGIARSSAPENT